MLGNRKAFATIGVKDLEAAKRFYEGALGLKASGPHQAGLLHFETGGAPLIVYVSGFAGTNQATAVTWNVGKELESLVNELKAKGVTFEHYDMPQLTRKGDIHTSGTKNIAWFKDPDGNIHALASE
jgi:catechol 2,3-dioxygenase-like lactoylglutathione lyase family enzyme